MHWSARSEGCLQQLQRRGRSLWGLGEFEERPGRVGGLEWPTVMPSSRALCMWLGGVGCVEELCERPLWVRS